MKNVFYLCRCCSDTTVIYELLELVKETSKRLTFHIPRYDKKKKQIRTFTISAKKGLRRDYNGNLIHTIEWNSSRPEFKSYFIKCIQMEDDKEPKKFMIRQ